MKIGVTPLAAVAVMALGANGCTAQTTPLRFAETPLWASDDIGITDVTATQMQGNAAIVEGEVGAESRLVTVDLTTGEVVWTLDADQELFGGEGEVADITREEGVRAPNGEFVITGDARDWHIMVPYRLGDEMEDDSQEYGVAALSGRDGAVVWTKEAFTGPRPDSTGSPGAAVLATEDVVLVRPWDSSSHPADPVTALDADGGEQLWEENLEGWPHHAENGVIVTVSADDYPYEREDWRTHETGNAVGWDADSGKKLWKLSDDWSGHRLKAVVNETAIVMVDRPEDRYRDYIAVGVTTGEHVADLGEGYGHHDCLDDGDYMVTCQDGDELLTIDTRDHSVVQGELDFEGETNVERVGGYHDQTYVRMGPEHQESPIHVVDAQGALIGRDVPGEPAAIHDGHAIFLTSDAETDSTWAAIHRVAS